MHTHLSLARTLASAHSITLCCRDFFFFTFLNLSVQCMMKEWKWENRRARAPHPSISLTSFAKAKRNFHFHFHYENMQDINILTFSLLLSLSLSLHLFPDQIEIFSLAITCWTPKNERTMRIDHFACNTRPAISFLQSREVQLIILEWF